jgi:predicted nucleic acid-binding protein
MRIFLDANILVSVLNKEYPLFSFTSRILSLSDKKNFILYSSPICLAIAYYFAEKKFKREKAKKIALLCDHIQIASVNESAVNKTLQTTAINNFEDGLEYYSALENKCDVIITEDIGDFYFSKIEVLRSEDFFKIYLFKNK